MKFLVGMLATVASLLAAPAFAGDDPAYDRVFMIPHVSTLGAGVEAGYRFGRQWQVRAGMNGFAGNFVYKRDDYDLQSRVSLLNAGVTVDYFPVANEFYVSGGARLSANRIEGKVKNLRGRLKNGADVFVPNPLTNFTVTQNIIQPYLGAGYSVMIRKGLSLNFDLGALYAGTPSLDVDSRAHKLGFSKKDTRREIERAQERISPFRVYPVVKVGLKFDF